ncbi:hypothetical protein [Microbacterium sp. T32]|uniref:hypothetical protein n=1 Tax=Microbacterium sp. T32 TaxID=1776083 RepID=UPI0007AB4303|nr:hypothetical protein [Microbacterium sp. T32]KZE39698.1 hypothetical protein AVW09_15645 [Microbacterium sp. T32]
MRGHAAAVVIVVAALILAMAIFCAGGYYYVEYQVWDATTSAYIYRARPYSGAVLGVSVVLSAAVLYAAAVMPMRAGRVHGSPVLDECPARAEGFTPSGDTTRT